MASKDWRNFDWVLVAGFLFLCIIGSIEIYFSTRVDGHSPYLVRHLVRIGLGMVLYLVVLLVDYRIIFSRIFLLYGFFLLILLYVLTFGVEVKSSKSWINVAGIQFQPSEMAKIVVILALARFLDDFTEKHIRLVPALTATAIWGLPVGLIILQHDLGTALTLAPVFLVLLILAGLPRRVIITAMLVGTLALGGAWSFLQKYQKERIMILLDLEKDPKKMGYQTIQSIIALGSGGIGGRGLGGGSQGHMGFLPEKHTDFIFSLVGEEMGLLGAGAVLAIYALIFWRGYRIALETTDRKVMYAVVGIVTLYGVHLVLNVGMTLGWVPVIGIPLPPLSFGGSSVVTSFAAMALLNNFRIHRAFL